MDEFIVCLNTDQFNQHSTMTDRLTRDEVSRDTPSKHIHSPLHTVVGGNPSKKLLSRRGKSFEQYSDCTPTTKVDRILDSEYLSQTNVKRSSSDQIMKAKNKMRNFTRSHSLHSHSDEEFEERASSSFLDVPNISFEEEEQQILSEIQAIVRHQFDATKTAEILTSLSKAGVTYPHYNVVEPIAQSMSRFPDCAKVINAALDAAKNLMCSNANEILECSMKAALAFPRDAKLQSKIIPLIADRSVGLIIDSLCTNLHHASVATKVCLYFSQKSVELDDSSETKLMSALSMTLFAHSKQNDIVNLASTSLLNLARSDRAKLKLKETVLLEDIILLISTHNRDVTICVTLMTVLMYIVEHMDFSPEWLTEIAVKAKNVVLQTMNTFSQKKKLQEVGCRILFYLPMVGDSKRASKTALNALKLLETGTTPLTLIVLFTSRADYAHDFISYGGLAEVMKRIKDNHGKVSVVEKTCALISNVINVIPDSDDIKLEATGLMIKIMGENVDNKNIVGFVMYGLYRLVMSNAGAFIDNGCGPLILRCLREHLNEAPIQECGCGLITYLLTSLSNEIDHSDGLVAILSALIEHSSNKKVFSGICICLKLAFACHGHDPMWVHEFLPLVESACYDFPSHLKAEVLDAVKRRKIAQPVQQDLSLEEHTLLKNSRAIDKEGFNFRTVYILVPPTLSSVQTLRKITGGTAVAHAKEQNAYSELGVEKFDWNPQDGNNNFSITLYLVKYSTMVPMDVLFAKEALYVLILDIEDSIDKFQNSSSSLQGDFLMKGNVRESGIMDILSESVLKWIKRIHAAAHGALIMPFCIKNELCNDETMSETSFSIETILEQRFLEHFSQMHSSLRPNVVFDNFNEVNMKRQNHNLVGFSELRKKIMITVNMMESTLTCDAGYSHPATLQALEIILQLQQCFHVMEVNECYMYIRTFSHESIPDSNIKLAIEYFVAKGEIIHFQNLGREVNDQSYIVLNLSWIIASIHSIFRGGNFEELALEVREIKRDCFIEDRNLNCLFESYLNCPIITREDIDVLFKNCDFASNALNDEKDLKVMKSILKRLGVIEPIEVGINSYGIRPYFIPRLLEVENSSVWNYRCSHFRKKLICSSWLLENRALEGLEHNLIKLLLEYSHSFIQAPDGETGTKITLCEALCWQDGSIMKFGVKGRNSVTEEYVEVSLQFSDRCSNICIAPDEMKFYQKRIILSAKGSSVNGIDNILNGGYLMTAMAVETTLASYSELRYERQFVCPCCLASHRIQEAETMNYDYVRSLSETEVVQCAKGHIIPKELLI